MLKFVEDLLQGALVEWKTLGEVMVRTKGIPITASQMRLLNRSDGAVKIFAGGKTVAYLAYEDLPLHDIHFTPSIIVKSRGLVEFEYYDKAFSHKNELWSYHSMSETVDTKFVYFFLKTKETLLRTKAAIMGAMPQISIPDTENILIPIPPLRVQEKIVEILDKFTELEAELEARAKQFEYYRNKLLTFGEEVEWKTLGEVLVSIRTGLNPRQFFKLNTEDAVNDYITIRELYKGFIVPTERTDKINNEALRLCQQRSNLEIGDILFSATGTIGEMAVVKSPPTNWNIKEGVYALKPNSLLVLPSYIRYILSTDELKKQIRDKTEGSMVQSISMKGLRQITIPVPSLSEQARIVAILDKFDKLVNSLCEGLPREIELRHKQYEYYRDQLLSFPS